MSAPPTAIAIRRLAPVRLCRPARLGLAQVLVATATLRLVFLRTHAILDRAAPLLEIGGVARTVRLARRSSVFRHADETLRLGESPVASWCTSPA